MTAATAATARVLGAGALAFVVGARVGLAASPSVELPFTQFSATMLEGETIVSCALSMKADLVRLVIKYRTDGVCPADANDGTSLLDLELPHDKPALVLERRIPGVADAGSACFSAFVGDSSGGIRARATAHVDVPDIKVPEPPTNLRRAGPR